MPTEVLKIGLESFLPKDLVTGSAPAKISVAETKVEPTKPAKAAKVKATPPEIKPGSLKELMELTGAKYYNNGGWRGNFTLSEHGNVLTSCDYCETNKTLYAGFASYIKDGVLWTAEFSVKTSFMSSERYGSYVYRYHVDAFSFGKWKRTEGIHRHMNLINQDEAMEWAKRERPYFANWLNSLSWANKEIGLACPSLEILYKAGYAFANAILSGSADENEIQCANRLIHRDGRSPKDIFKTPKAVYSVLKEEKNLSIWDSIRKLDKFGRISAENIRDVYDSGFSAKDIGEMAYILGRRCNGKPVFSWTSLLNYLRRLDTFEAINRQEAFQLLRDYLYMCELLNITPRIDGDSLKREHDVTARTFRARKDEITAEKLNAACTEHTKFNYEESVFFVRHINSYDDLIDEATQQHNCVASYANRIIKGQSLIFVMREKSNPDRSLITIELDPRTKQVRQKLLAYNRPIHNKAQTEFINRWVASIKSK